MSEMPKVRLFLSYGRKDAAELANRLRVDLENRGYEVWQDTREIRPGKEWEDQITDGLRSTQVVVALLSPHAVRRATDPGSPDNVDSVCLDELTFARFAAPPTPIVPVMAVPCEPPFPVFRLDYVSMTQWMRSEDEYRTGLERLLLGIESAVSGRPPELRRWHHRLPVFDFAAHLHEKRRDFVGRQWLFDEIDAWRASSTRERALLIIGDPGIGKSAFVAEMIHRNPGGQVLAYHICRADDPETLRASTFVTSLTGMIAGRLPALADLLDAPQYQEIFAPDSVSRRPASVFEQGLIAALHQLTAPPDGPRYLLIDGLDEVLTLREGQPDVIALLSQVDRFPAWLRIVATTRRDPDVLNRLSGLRAASIDAHREDNLEDIDRFVESRLKSPDLAERLTASRLSLATVQKKLRQKADGNFLYVSQLLQDVERDNYSFARLDDLPQGLTQWYEAWFTRKFPNPKTDFVDARKLLEVILLAKEPLSKSRIMDAASLLDEYEFERTLAELSQFLIEVSGKVVVYHKSLADWLHRTNHYRVSETSGHRLLSVMCQKELMTMRPKMGMHTDYGKEPYCRFVLQHLAGHRDWPTYRALLMNDTVVSLIFPLDFERGRGAWDYFTPQQIDWWGNPEVRLPAQALELCLEDRMDLLVAHGRFFLRAASMLSEMYGLERLPDYGASKNRPGFRDACYGTFVSCSLGLDFLEQTHALSISSHKSLIAGELAANQNLLRTLRAIETPRSTGLSGQLEDMTSMVISRWHTLLQEINQ